MATLRQSMSGKTCVVTGATSGIGRETAAALAAMGAQVVLVARNRELGERVRADLALAGGDVHLALAELASLADTRRLAAELLDRLPRIDVLLNNAGAINPRRETTVDGFERTFAVNHLAHYLLTRLLLPRLRASAPSRVVSVSSAAHLYGRLAFDDLQAERRYGAMKAYSRSKLANVLFSFELARRLQGTGVTANCLHPGVIASNFGRSGSGAWRLAFGLVRPFMSTPAQGARTSIYLASSPEVEGISGTYFARRRPARTSREARDAAVARRLWDVSAQLTGLPPDLDLTRPA